MKDLGQIMRAVFLLAVSSVLVLAQGPVEPYCGMVVTTDVLFTGDLDCPIPTNALTVGHGVDRITIDLNGKTLSCAALSVSCQNTGAVGIDTNNGTNIVIKGPGSIWGFDFGVHVKGGNKVTVQDLIVSGPPSAGPLWNSRVSATGIKVTGVSCPGSVIIDGNEVAHHRHGIMLDGVSCVKVQRNDVHENNSDAFESFGIWLFDSPRNVVTNNMVKDNGMNNSFAYVDPQGDPLFFDGGLVLEGSATTKNRVSQNNVTANCGDGISARNGAESNAIGNNLARNNPLFPGLGSQGTCWQAPDPAVNFDLAARNEGASGNSWRKNNDCGTYLGIPDNVCP